MIQSFDQFVNENQRLWDRIKQRMEPIDSEVNWQAVENSQAMRFLKNNGFSMAKVDNLLPTSAKHYEIAKIFYLHDSLEVDGIEFKQHEYAMGKLIEYIIYGNGQIKLEEQFELNVPVTHQVEFNLLGNERWTTEKMIRKFYSIAQNFVELKKALLVAYDKRVDKDTSDVINDLW